MSTTSIVFTKVSAALILLLAIAAFLATYVTQVIGAQMAKESGFRVTESVSCTPGQSTENDAHFSGCSSLI
jgi:hypothetical protein